MKTRRADERVDASLPERAAALRTRVRQLELRTRRLASDAIAGAYRSGFRGAGIEFEEVRPYLVGDDVRSIDWNVTARTGEPHVKRFAEERQLRVHLLVDVSASMDFGTRGPTKREAAAEFVGLVAAAAAAQRDPVALELFGARAASRDIGHVEPERGASHVLRLLRAVLEAREPGTGAGGSGLVGALEELARVARRSSLVFVVSDFLDVHGDAWRAPLERIGARHDLVLAHVVDAFEERLPDAGIVPFVDGESGARAELDTSSRAVRAQWEKRARERRERIGAAASRARAELLRIETWRPVHEPLLEFFRRRVQRRGAGA